MHRTNLRKVGGSVMLTVPPAYLELLGMKAGSTVSVSVVGDQLVVQRPRQTLADLLAQCDPSAEPDTEVRAEDERWTTGAPVGGELI